MTIKVESQNTDEIIKGCLKSDKKSQRQLYEMFAPLMLSVCRRYICDFDSAQDVMIKAFMVVFDKLSQFRHEGSFEGWIRRIMVRESISFLRQQKKIQFFIEDTFVKEDYGNNINTNIEVAEIQQLIDALPEGYKMVFVMYAIEGYKHQEISDMLNIAIGTSKSQLFKARKMLQEKLKELNKTTSYGAN